MYVCMYVCMYIYIYIYICQHASIAACTAPTTYTCCYLLFAVHLFDRWVAIIRQVSAIIRKRCADK